MTIPFEYFVEAYIKFVVRKKSDSEVRARLTHRMSETASTNTEAQLKDEIIKEFDIETLDRILAESESLMNEDNAFASDIGDEKL